MDKIIKILKEGLPPVVTKEQLMNYFIHEIQCKEKGFAGLTVSGLIYAAKKANIEIKGYSNLDINIPPEDKSKFRDIREVKRKPVRPKLEKESEFIISSYKSGVTLLSLANHCGCEASSIKRFLKDKGIKLRRGNTKVVNL